MWFDSHKGAVCHCYLGSVGQMGRGVSCKNIYEGWTSDRWCISLFHWTEFLTKRSFEEVFAFMSVCRPYKSHFQQLLWVINSAHSKPTMPPRTRRPLKGEWVSNCCLVLRNMETVPPCHWYASALWLSKMKAIYSCFIIIQELGFVLPLAFSISLLLFQ